MAHQASDAYRACERGPAHWDCDTDQPPTGGCSRESSAMGASLTERRRVEDEGLRVVNSCREGGRSKLDLPLEEARAKFMPAAAVRRTVLTLFGITGLEARVGGWGRRLVKAPGSTGELAPKRH